MTIRSVPSRGRVRTRPPRTRGRVRTATVDGVVGTRDVPPSVRALSSLPDADYVDLFTLRTDARATPEQWARAMFGDVPDAVELLVWRGLLGMRLNRGRSPDTVAGWLVAERGENWVRLVAASWFLTGNLVIRATDGRVSLATFVRYDRRFGRLVWTPLSAVHRRLAPGLLRDAAAKVRDPAPGITGGAARGHRPDPRRRPPA